MLLHLRIDGGVRADSAAHPPDRHLVRGARQPLLRTVQLRHPTRDLETERDGLGHHAVSASGHERAAMADRQVGRGLAHGREIVRDDARRLDQLHRSRRVVQVLARPPNDHRVDGTIIRATAWSRSCRPGADGPKMLWEWPPLPSTKVLGSIIKPFMTEPRNHLAKAPVLTRRLNGQ